MPHRVNHYLNQVLHNKRKIPQPFVAPYDVIASQAIEAAYGLRRLFVSYTGNLIQLRNIGTGAVQDFGYDASGNLDTTGIATFLGAANGFITIWYDQSGHGRNLTQTNTVFQPKYLASAVNNRPSIQFDGSNDIMFADYPVSTYASTLHLIGKVTTHFNFERFITYVSATNNPHSLGVAGTSGTFLAAGKTTGQLPVTSGVGSYYVTETVFTSEPSIQIFLNGSAAATTGATTSVSNQGNVPDQKMSVGGRQDTVQLACEIAELIISSSAWSTTVRNNAESIANNYYNIYVPIPDVTVAVDTVSTVTSRTEMAFSMVDNPPYWSGSAWATAKTSFDSITKAYKIHIFPFGLLDPWNSDSSGKTESSPSKLSNAGNYLDTGLTKIREISATAPIILTLYSADWWMKHDLANNVLTDLTSASQYDDNGRVKNSALADWLILVDAAVVVAASHGVRDFEVWNEAKGYYDVYPHVGQTWDSTMNTGNGVDNIVMGYGYFYKKTAQQVVDTMTRLGYSRNAYRIGGPYPVLATTGPLGGNAVPSTDPLYAYGLQWGYADKANINFAKAFLTNVQNGNISSTLFDTFLIDISTFLHNTTTVQYPSQDPFDYTAKFSVIFEYWRDQLAAHGFDRDFPMDISEIYAVLEPPNLQTPTGQDALRAALWADMWKACVLSRIRYPLLWGATASAMGTNSNESGLVVDPRTAGGGTLQRSGDVAKMFHDNFATGTVVYKITPSDSRVDGLASATKAILYNKTNTTLIVQIDGSNYTFSAYETKLLTRP